MPGEMFEVVGELVFDELEDAYGGEDSHLEAAYEERFEYEGDAYEFAEEEEDPDE